MRVDLQGKGTLGLEKILFVWMYVFTLCSLPGYVFVCCVETVEAEMLVKCV